MGDPTEPTFKDWILLISLSLSVFIISFDFIFFLKFLSKIFGTWLMIDIDKGNS